MAATNLTFGQLYHFKEVNLFNPLRTVSIHNKEDYDSILKVWNAYYFKNVTHFIERVVQLGQKPIIRKPQNHPTGTDV